MTAFLEHEDLWKSIERTEEDERKLARAKAKLILCIDPINYSHIQNAGTAKEVWEKLQASFEDSGLTRKVSLLRTMATTRLEKCNSVEDYVNEIITTAHKLSGLGFPVSDEWVGTLLLAGLPEEYRPMIMGIESSGMTITADAIKTKILQDVKDARTGKNSDHQTPITILREEK
ncbi:retrovirus-related pol polyprotein from transposon tnt 1-94 [Lasius niger]|uniref:Retrovirus-related pol polyprotein from transposon tnt 1-94 n=1 Tax=Lasius niger TaxID=67767 RepID=A0A0J7JZR0_LASNI|nr:retrovirus-related pol polyprotein from transposon tnt 1-94 [Lasius niger]